MVSRTNESGTDPKKLNAITSQSEVSKLNVPKRFSCLLYVEISEPALIARLTLMKEKIDVWFKNGNLLLQR